MSAIVVYKIKQHPVQAAAVAAVVAVVAVRLLHRMRLKRVTNTLRHPVRAVKKLFGREHMHVGPSTLLDAPTAHGARKGPMYMGCPASQYTDPAAQAEAGGLAAAGGL